MRFNYMRMLIACLGIALCQLAEANSKKVELNMNLNVNNLLWNITEQFTQYCFSSATNLIIIPGISNDDENKAISSISTREIPSYIFGRENNEIFQKHQRFRHIYKLEPTHVEQKIYPATSVTIFISQNIDFSKLLTNLKNSIWWNSRAKFLLVNMNSFGCEIFPTVLALLWSFNILSVIYMCWDSEKQVAAYTINPYSHAAPNFWTPVAMVTDMNEECTLFQHTFELSDEVFPMIEDSTFCDTLYFDKSQNMYGYKFKLLVIISTPLNEYRTGCEICKTTNCKVVCDVKAMNATYVLKFTILKGLVNSDGKPYSNINEIVSGMVDLTMFSMFLRDYWWLQTYPYLNDEIKIVTPLAWNYKFHFFLLFKPASWLFMILLCILTVLSLKQILKKNPTMEFARIFVGSSTLREPKRKFEWVCFICLIYMWFIINVYIQSNYQADKITIKQKPIDSVEDLIKSDYSVCGLSSYSDFLWHEKIRDRFVGKAFVNSCLDFSSNGKLIASIIGKNNLKLFLPANASVHISKSNLLERGQTWLVSEDSPLLLKFNSIISRLNQAGIPNFYSKLQSLTFERNSHDENYKADPTDFFIALRILFGGWMLALVVFIFEIVVRIILNRANIVH